MDDIKFSIVIPAYNEEGVITASLTQVLNFMTPFEPSFEIIVVDDGSSDKTAEKVADYAQYHPELKLIRAAHKGKAAAVRTGVLNTKGEFVLTVDADMATPIDELKRFMHWVDDHGYDIVIASREGRGALRKGEPKFRHIIGRTFNLFVRLMALPEFPDTQCGFKLYKGELARDVFGRLVVYADHDEVIKKPFFGAFDVEVLFISKLLGYKIKSVPVTWTYIKTSRLNFWGNSVKMALDVLKIRLNGLKGVYRR